MAGCDYYLCDMCGAKTFYDAEVAYDHSLKNPKTGHLWPDYVGFMCVLCIRCAETEKGIKLKDLVNSITIQE